MTAKITERHSRIAWKGCSCFLCNLQSRLKFDCSIRFNTEIKVSVVVWINLAVLVYTIYHPYYNTTYLCLRSRSQVRDRQLSRESRLHWKYVPPYKQAFAYAIISFLNAYAGWRKNGATGHPISLQIFRKLHDRIAWKLVDFCNIICWTQSLTFCLKISSRFGAT